MDRLIKQFSFPIDGVEATLTSGTTSVEYDIDFYGTGTDKHIRVDDSGQFSVVGYVQCSSSTATVTISYKNVYGTEFEGSYFTLGTISATTTKQYFEYLLHIDNTDNLNSDATGGVIKISRPDTEDLLHLGRVILG